MCSTGSLRQFDSAVDDVFGYYGQFRSACRDRFPAPRTAFPQGFRSASSRGRGCRRAAAASLRLAEHRPCRAASRAGVPRHPHRILREAERVLMPEGSIIISGFNPLSLWGASRLFGRAATSRPGTALHRPVAPARLAAPARVRAQWRPLRLLCAAVREHALARALALHGKGGRPLVADRRRRVRGARGEAHGRHAPGQAELERPRRGAGACAGDLARGSAHGRPRHPQRRPARSE